jgi:two-component system response regulator PhoP
MTTKSSPWILVVDADSHMCESKLMPGLEHAGFNVVGAGTAAEAYRCMLGRTFSLFVLGSNLPDADVPTLARCLRSITDAGIVVMRDRKSHLLAKHIVLGEIADAFLDKPIDLKNMVKTLRNLSRRLKPSGKSRIASQPTSGWRLETSGWDLVSPNGAMIHLNQSERLLIQTLASSSGKPIDRSDIISLLSPGAADFGRHRLEMLIYRLRRKVNVATREPLPLKSVRGVGYVFVS